MFKEKLAKLCNVKSIMTILLSITFMILSLTHYVAVDSFNDIFTIIVVFYFGTQAAKKE